MVEQDTIKLLRECDAGIRMGVASIEEVADHAKNRDLRAKLTQCKEAHEALKTELLDLLDQYGDEGKAPNTMARGMSWFKTNMKLSMDESDHTIADLMIDGCDMGVKSLSRYLNQYKAADEQSKNIAKRLIHLEAKLSEDLRAYL